MTVQVRGNATAEELAAVLAVVAQREAPSRPDGYERWRAGRLAARDAGVRRRCATIMR
jgi:hypothetical protein